MTPDDLNHHLAIFVSARNECLVDTTQLASRIAVSQV